MAPRCRQLKARSAFMSADTNCTRQWMSRDRRCLACVPLDRQEAREARYQTQARNIPIWSGCVGMLFLAVAIIKVAALQRCNLAMLQR